MTTQRALGVTYTNTDGRPRFISITATNTNVDGLVLLVLVIVKLLVELSTKVLFWHVSRVVDAPAVVGADG